MPASIDSIRNYLRLKHLSCQFLIRCGESSKVWQAVAEAAELVDYLELCLEFERFQARPGGEPRGLAKAAQNARSLFRRACEIMRVFFEPQAKLDPTLQRHRDSAMDALRFREDLHAVPVNERERRVDQMLGRFKSTMPDPHGFTGYLDILDRLEEKAKDELADSWRGPAEQIGAMLPALTFCDRGPLYELGVFRICQDQRHRVFGDSDPLDKMTRARIYLTPAVDEYLFERDRWTWVLRSWGRFIPLTYNHMLIKYYHEPGYWQNRHMTLGPGDHLRLGFAHYQYAMEMGRDSDFSRMNYRKALNGFKQSGMRMPTQLYSMLWGK